MLCEVMVIGTDVFVVVVVALIGDADGVGLEGGDVFLCLVLVGVVVGFQ